MWGNFHIHTVHLDIIQVFFIHQLKHKGIVLKTILKFTLKLTLKQLLHVSVQSPSSGSALFELAEVKVVKIINQNTSVWLNNRIDQQWCQAISISGRL
jgi:hypothetical protein